MGGGGGGGGGGKGGGEEGGGADWADCNYWVVGPTAHNYRLKRKIFWRGGPGPPGPPGLATAIFWRGGGGQGPPGPPGSATEYVIE